MPLPERLSYLYNAADFSEMAIQYANTSPSDFHEWWHNSVPPEVIIKIMSAYALGQVLGAFTMADPEWNRVLIQVTSVEDDKVFLIDRDTNDPIPEPFILSKQEPPRAIGHGDVRIIFEKDITTSPVSRQSYPANQLPSQIQDSHSPDPSDPRDL
jgi:hypothetical protein